MNRLRPINQIIEGRICSLLAACFTSTLFVFLSGSCLSASDETSPAEQKIYFEDKVKSLLKARCIECHNPEEKEAGLDLSSAEGILKGSESGRIIQPGDAETSLIVEMIEAEEMPPDEKDHLSEEELKLLKDWIHSGAAFRESVVQKPEVTQHDIIPLLHLRCVACHGGRRKEADLDLRTKESILKGGKSGPVVIPGKPEESLLVKRVLSEEMPPRRQLVSVSVKTMEETELKLLSRWIELELPELEINDSETEDHLVSDKDRQFWSFRPVIPVKPPAVKNSDQVHNPIDAFILEKLEAIGLKLSPPADRRTILRRLYYDLTGLPPTPEEMEAFLKDNDPDAYEKRVDQLLASPHYGEKWARHWLDVAGYADSEGAQNQDLLRPHIYRYRDYVIQSFNEDKPYSRFLMEQIAGDELSGFEEKKEIDQETYDCLVATGFLRTAPDRTFADITNFVPDRLEIIADEMDILGTAVMGLTIKCARCHSHKFDPIPQRDYYRLTAIFKEAYDEHDWLKSQGPRTLPNVTTRERQEYEKELGRIAKQVSQLKSELEKFSQDDPEKDRKKEEIEKRIKELEGTLPSEPRIRALWSRHTPSPSYILKRGNYLTPGNPVEPGVPAVLVSNNSYPEFSNSGENGRQEGRRLVFAKWLTRPENPLTSRVMVNRIWMHYFGRGIVNTPGNFGHAGEKPTHPELLDWLSDRFIQSGWSMKHIHRLIVTSATYQQGSLISETAVQHDPDGIFLSRMPLKRMEAEVLRDTLLFISGQLDETMYGPGTGVEVRADGLVTSSRSEKGWRRSIYVLQRRTQIPTILENFDYPQMGPNCIRRRESLVAPQALHLMNDQMVYDLASSFAGSIYQKHKENPSDQIKAVYLKAFGRNPSGEELNIAIESLNQFAEKWKNSGEVKEVDVDLNLKSLANFCHVVFNLAELQYID